MERKKKSILEWYQENHKFIDAPCGGEGTCGRCKIKFQSEAPKAQDRERMLLTSEELDAGIRLACMTELPEGIEHSPEEIKFYPVQSEFWETAWQGDEKGQEIEKFLEEKQYAVLLDIGTTTLAMCLVDVDTRQQVATITGVNHQRVYGADVISRIKAANEGKLKPMQDCILCDIASLLEELLFQTKKETVSIKKILIAGNTTMCHILLGYSCVGLAQKPFCPVSLAIEKMSSRKLFESVQQRISEYVANLSAQVIILPGITAFVGADILSGMYAHNMDRKDEISLLVDIGTNGEMVIGNETGFMVTSTAAGPVFEGGNISCGMPAVSGAIAHVHVCNDEEVDSQVGDFYYEILDQKSKIPKGFCGSGLIDLVALLRRKGVIDENGTLQDPYFENGFFIESSLWEEKSGITLQQSDIRELQMGKAAIRAGIELLTNEFRKHGSCQEVKQLYLAGGFGSAINVTSAREIGLFPETLVQNVIPVGNAVLAGLYQFIFDENGEQRLCDIIEKSREVSLAEHIDFENIYIQSMQF